MGVLRFFKFLILYWYVIDFFYFRTHLIEFMEVELAYQKINCVYDTQHGICIHRFCVIIKITLMSTPVISSPSLYDNLSN